MSAPARLALQIDVLDLYSQPAQALPDLAPNQLIAAIVDEFQELQYLSTNPAAYQLVRLSDHSPLQDELTIGEQLADGEGVALIERDAPLPPETTRPSRSIYLRETLSGQVFLLQWLPAIIGRRDPSQRHHERVAVSLEAYRSGLRVSRRHLQILERNGHFYVYSLAVRNPAYLRESNGNTRAIMEEPQPLRHGDTIVLERSGIALRFIIREPQPIAAHNGATATQEALASSTLEENRHE